MELSFLHNTKFDFIGKRKLFFAVSALFIFAGIASLVLRGGPNYGIDFSGGTLLQIAFDKPAELNNVREALDTAGIQGYELQSSGSNAIIIRAKKADIDPDKFAANVMDIFKQKFTDRTAVVERTEYVGPSVGKHLGKQAFYALIFSFFGIIVYVAFRFHSALWGAAGGIGIIHDVFIVFGLFSLMNKEINLTIIAALLTVAGFSINDTIVIFDRIRENLRLINKEDFGAIINRSINETLSRTIITSFTVVLVVLLLYFLGGVVLHDFALALLIGLFIGSYSTIFVCTPLVYEWDLYKKRRSAQLRATVQKR